MDFSTKDQLDFSITSLVGFTLVTMMVFNRLYVRVFSRWGWTCLVDRRAWHLCDVLVLLAWVVDLYPLSVGIWRLSVFGVRESLANSGTPEQRMTYLKLGYVYGAVYFLPIYMVKGSLLLLFAEFVPRYRGRLWWSIVATGTLCFVGFLTTVGVWLFSCPVLSGWEQHLPEIIQCGSKKFIPNFIAAETFHITTDLLVLTIPFCLLRRLQNLSPRERTSAACMFAFGSLSVACAIFDAGWVYLTLSHPKPFDPKTPGWEMRMGYYGGFVESFTVMFVACVPSLKITAENVYFRFVESKRCQKGETASINESQDQDAADIESGRSPEGRETSENCQQTEK